MTDTHRTGITEPSHTGRALMDLQQQLAAARAERDAAIESALQLVDWYGQACEQKHAVIEQLARVTAERDGLRTALRELRDAEATLSKAKVDAAQAQAATGAASDDDSDEVFAEKIRVRNEMFDAQMRCAERLLAAREQADAALQPATEDGR